MQFDISCRGHSFTLDLAWLSTTLSIYISHSLAHSTTLSLSLSPYLAHSSYLPLSLSLTPSPILSLSIISTNISYSIPNSLSLSFYSLFILSTTLSLTPYFSLNISCSYTLSCIPLMFSLTLFPTSSLYVSL